MRRVLTATLALALLAGCPSYTTMQSPRTVDPGKVEITAGAGLSGSMMFGVIPTIEAPHLEFGANIGLVPNLNLWLRADLYTWVGGGLKLRFVNHPKFQAAIAPEATINLAMLAGGALAGLIPDMNAEISGWTASVPIVFGIPMGEHLFVFGPKATISNMTVAGAPEGQQQLGGGIETLLAGGVIGIDFKYANLRIMPELDLFYDFGTYGLMVQAGISTRFGG